MDKRLIFRYCFLIITSDGRTEFDKSSGHMVGRLNHKLALIGKSVEALK